MNSTIEFEGANRRKRADVVLELLPLICTFLTGGEPGSLVGLACPLSQVPLAMICGVKVVETRVMLSPFLMVTEDCSNCVSFICTFRGLLRFDSFQQETGPCVLPVFPSPRELMPK